MVPDGKINIKKNIEANQAIKVSHTDALYKRSDYKNIEETKYFVIDSTFKHTHQDRYYNDYATQSLLMHNFSNQGPGLAVGDINGDGLEDVFVGGSYGFNSTVFYQNKKGDFVKKELPDTELYEDEGALIFDANNDGALDLYVVSGGSERYDGHKCYQDRIYYNVNGNLQAGELPVMLTSTSTITGGDFDNDGDIDLFIGGRVVQGKYPTAPSSYILENNLGSFKDVTNTVCPFLNDAGMITSAIWTDFDNDNHLDLIVVGEFMPITILKGTGKQLKNITKESNLENSTGLWNSIQSGDFDNDGDIDFIAGNLGLNSTLKINDGHPIKIDYADFDNNGSIDPIYSKYEEGHYYPIATLDQLIGQLPKIKKKFQYYNNFAKSTTEDILELFNMPSYNTLKANELRSSYIENLGNNKFSMSPLPMEVQIAPINGILTEDINDDGLLDLLLVGNDYNTEVNSGRYDASIGHVLINDGKGSFKLLNNKDSGFSIIGDSKSIVKVQIKNKSLILVGKNNAEITCLAEVSNLKNTIKPNKNEAFAKITFQNGAIRKDELNLGGGYLSQTSNIISVTPKMKTISFYDHLGKKTRSIDLK
ncbi:FG-GAP repeat domain-containing protein [Thalassobellus suaedae]|uniref:VCBS repeat-containing protein n=1 Tax=Thalassobellus suaedae TaxID=3074124 RepID=A0ABY9XTE0_9FLAO|nr:VCBS repeat-containing protein [Flavobacteriaceae bacterium HL-DH14]